jgi:hypothetical protein
MGNLQYRFDAKYKNSYPHLIAPILKFFSKTYSPLKENDKLKLHFFDFVLYGSGKLLEGAEIKTQNETANNASSWFSYHKNSCFSSQLLEELGDLSPIEKGFVATFNCQMKSYALKSGLGKIWLIQESLRFLQPIERSLEFLKGKGLLKGFYLFPETTEGLLFVKVVY